MMYENDGYSSSLVEHACCDHDMLSPCHTLRGVNKSTIQYIHLNHQ